MESSKQEDYSYKYYEILSKFVSKPNDHSKLYLEALVNSKIKELSKESETNFEKSLQKFILELSLYFIKDNSFVVENYFSLIDNSIYKNFYDFLNNPTKSQYEKFLKSFFELNYGATTIFLICSKLCEEEIFGQIPFDLFFIIIIKKNRSRLQKILGEDFPLDENHDKIIQRLACFTKIRNKIEIRTIDLLNLFKKQDEENMKKNAITKIDNNNESFQINQNINKLSDKEIEELKKESKSPEIKNIHGQKKKNKKTKNAELNISKINVEETAIEDKKDNKIREQSKNVINLNLKEESLKEENKFYNYLVKMKEKYRQLQYETPVLDYLIGNKKKLEVNFFKYTKNEDVIIDHLYNNLVAFIINTNLNIIDFGDEKYGYLCYYYKDGDKKRYVESIFSLVDLSLLSDRISSELNFPKDKFKNPDKKQAQNVFKSRSLCFEYFINSNILIKKFNLKEKARVIYSFKSIEDLESVNNNIIKIKKNIIEKGLEELDGVLFIENKISLDLEKNCFMIDNPFKFGIFLGTDKQYSIQGYDLDSNKIYNNINPSTVELKKNTLALIEIKNQFPPYEEGNENENKPQNFYNMVKNLIRKVKIFKQIFEIEKRNIENIKILLFYDVIQKENYYDDLKEAVYDSFIKNDDELFDFEFQCVYIKASYLTGGLINTNDRLENLNDKLENVNRKLNALIDFIYSLNLPKEKLNDLSKII